MQDAGDVKGQPLSIIYVCASWSISCFLLGAASRQDRSREHMADKVRICRADGVVDDPCSWVRSRKGREVRAVRRMEEGEETVQREDDDKKKNKKKDTKIRDKS